MTSKLDRASPKQRQIGTIRASRQWNGKTFYAQNLPGDGGVDWGYTDKPGEALLLSPFFAKRFAANAIACGDKATLWDTSK